MFCLISTSCLKFSEFSAAATLVRCPKGLFVTNSFYFFSIIWTDAWRFGCSAALNRLPSPVNIRAELLGPGGRRREFHEGLMMKPQRKTFFIIWSVSTDKDLFLISLWAWKPLSACLQGCLDDPTSSVVLQKGLLGLRRTCSRSSRIQPPNREQAAHEAALIQSISTECDPAGQLWVMV